MSKRIFALALALIMLLLVGCQPSGNDNNGGDKDGMNNSENGGQQNRGDGFVLKAVVKSINPDYIEVEVIESDYAFGIYWVRTGAQTEYFNVNGSTAGMSDLKAGQTISITYSGQTMMSLPPQIVAWSIQIK